MLEAAATAMHLVETGQLAARGPSAGLFRAPAWEPAPPGDLRVSRRPLVDPIARAMAEINAMINEAKTNPTAALRTMRMFAAVCGQDLYDRIRDDLVSAGVPVHFLPSRAEARQSSDLDVAVQ